MKPQTFGWAIAGTAAIALLALPAWGEVQPQGRELRINQRTDFRQQNPVAAFAPNGRSLVVWENDQRGLRGQLFAADGTPSGGELTLAASDAIVGSQEQQIATRRDPSVAFLAGGGFVLAWTEGVEDVESSAFIETRSILDQDVYVQRFDNLGSPAGSRVRVNSTTAGFQRAPRLIPRGQGGLLVTWESGDGGVFVRTLGAAGEVTGREVRLNDGTGAHPAGAAGSLGTSLIAWEAADGSDVGVFARLVDRNGQPVGPAFRVNTTTTNRQRRPTVAAGTDGNFLVAWQGDLADPRLSHLNAQAVGAHGALVGPQLTLAQGIGYEPSLMAPALAPTPNGHFLLSWLGWPTATSPGLEMAAAEIDGLGNTVGTPVWISERRVQRNFRRTSIATNGSGSYLLSWESAADGHQVIDGRRLGAH
jgi:hypothetical protein